MSAIEVQLRQEDAKLVFLAVAYHLGRPGSELDPITKQPVEHGLAEVASSLQPQLRNAVATISLRENQARRLLSGMLGSITELKAYPMLELRLDAQGNGRRSTVPGFDRSLTHLFPKIDEDAVEALGLAERMLLLRRRLDEATTELLTEKEPEPPAPKRRGIWPFGKRQA
jgi:hypothetical protein